jgi:hypothetical protein
MRIHVAAIHGLGAYPFPPQSFTLISGRQIDPTVDTPGPDDCTPYQCGADPTNQAARMWCSYNGRVGARVCTDPSCAPYRDQIAACTLPAPAPPPSIFTPAPQPPVIPTLTPANIVQPLPDITQTLQPRPVQVPDCSLWCSINGAIADYPLIAAALLAGLAFAVWKGTKR